MKSFFSRLHDSTHTGHSKPASKESYKFRTPGVDPEREYAQPSNSHGEVAATYPTARHGGEKRSSSRAPKPSPTAPIPSHEQNTTTNATAGPSSEKVPNLGSKPNPSVPIPQYSQIPPQVTSKATSTRHRDYNDSKPRPPPSSATRPSYSTRTYAAQENAAKMSRHANSRSESTPAVAAHEIWHPPSNPPATGQVEEHATEPLRQEATETIHRYHSRNEVKDAAMNDTRREKDRDRPKDRDRDKDRDGDKDKDRDGERTRDREGGRGAGRDGGRERDAPRERYRQGRDREVDPTRDRERYRERDREQDREKEKELARQRGRERDREDVRERERGKEAVRVEEVEKGRRERERPREPQPAERERERRDRDRELQRQAELAREAEKREREGELQRQADREQRETQRQAEREQRERTESQKQAERERERERRDRDRELRRQMEIARENDRLKQERDRDAQRQAEAEREKRDRERALQRQMEHAKEAERLKELHDRDVQQQELAREADREKRDRERAIHRQMEFAREAERAKEEREAQRQVELVREAEREMRERERAIQRQKEYAKEVERAREREREAERQAKEAERLKEELEREVQRQSELAQEAERVRERELQRQAELAKEAERARDRERRDRERAFQRQLELQAKELERQKQERDHQAELAKEAAERQRQERDREAHRQAELVKQAQEKELQRQAELAKEVERERERREHEKDLRRHAELARVIERQRQERERELQRQAELAKEAERERDRQEREKETQRLTELAKEAERERERRDRERERALQRQIELAKEVERLKEAREREVQRQVDLAKEAERIREREAEREVELAKEAEREREREREKRELQRQVELAKEVDRERERRDRERAYQQVELAREAARIKEERELELQRQANMAKENEQQQARDADLKRQIELAKEAEHEMRERERVAQLQLEHTKQAELLKDEHERQAQRQAEFAKEAEQLRERERERKDAERERERERRRERKVAEEKEREKDRERVRGTEFQREKEKDKDKERDPELAKGDERDRERTVNADKEREREQERHHQSGRRERERQHTRGQEFDRNRERWKDKELNPNRGGPNTRGRGTEDMVVAPEQQRQDRVVTESPKHDVMTQDRDNRRAREVRSPRETPIPRDRQRDQVRYRAEVTDGEQDVRKLRPIISADRDRRKGGSGWASDNYAVQTRKTSRPLASGERVQPDDGEGSDGSITKKHLSRKPQKRSVEEGSPNKALRSRKEKNLEGLIPSTVVSPIPIDLPQVKTLPTIRESKPPLTYTPQNVPVSLPPRDIPSDLEGSPAFVTIVANDIHDVPTRREINRLKLHTRSDDPSRSASTPQPVMQLSHSKTPFEPATPFSPQYPSRGLTTTQRQEPAPIVTRIDNWTVGSDSSRQIQTIKPVSTDDKVAESRVAQAHKEYSGNPHVQMEDVHKLPNETVFSTTTFGVDVEDTTRHGIQLVGHEPSNSNMLFEQSSVLHTPSNGNLQGHQGPQIPDRHPSIAIPMTKVDSYSTKPTPQILPLPIPTDVKRATLNNEQAPPQNFRISNAPLQPSSSETTPVLDIRVRNSKRRESPGTIALPLNEDTVEKNFSRNRNNSREQLPERGKSSQATNAWQHDRIVEKLPMPMEHKDLSRHRMLGSNTDGLNTPLDLNDMQRKQFSADYITTTGRQGADNRPTGAFENVPPVAVYKSADVGTRPPTSLAIKTDAATIDQYTEELSPQRLGNTVAKISQEKESPDIKEQNIKLDTEVHVNPTAETTVYWQSKQNSPKGIQWGSSTPVVSRSALHVSDEHARFVKQESPLRDASNTPLTTNTYASKAERNSPLLQTARSASKQDSPLYSGLRHGLTNSQIPDNVSALEQMVKSASSFPFVMATSTQAVDAPVATSATPKQDTRNILPAPFVLPSTSYSGPINTAPSTRAGDMHRHVTSSHIESMRVQQSQSGSRGHIGGQPVGAQPEGPLPKGGSGNEQLTPSAPSANDIMSQYDREGVIENAVGVDAPSLGFFTKSFSKALTKTTEDMPLSTTLVELMPFVENEVTAPVPWQVNNAVESPMAISLKTSMHRTALQNNIEFSAKAHSQFPPMEQLNLRKDSKEQADPAHFFKPPTPKPLDVNRDTEPGTESWQLPRLQPSKIQHPVLADLLSSPLAPQAPVISRNEVPLSTNSQETRQRTLSSSNANQIQPGFPKSGDSPLDRLQKDIAQHVPLHRYPPELPRQSPNNHAHGEVADRDVRTYSTRPATVQHGSHPDFLRQPSSQRHHIEPPQRPSTSQSRDIFLTQETRSMSTRPGQPQEVQVEAVREGQAQDANNQMMGPTAQSSAPPLQAQWRDIHTILQSEPVRQTPSQRYPLDSSQRQVVEQSREFPTAYEARTNSMKASSAQPPNSVAQERAPVTYDPLSAGRALPPFVHSSYAPQEPVPAEQITTSRHANRLGVVDSQDRRTSGMHSSTVHQGQPSSSTRPATSDPYQHKAHPQTSADSRFPNIPQTSASQVAAIMQQNSSRHRYSTSLPTFIPPSTAKQASREELPRSSTPAYTQQKSSSSQAIAGSNLAQLSTTSIPKAPSEETVLLTPSSLAHSLALKPTSSRQSVTPSVASQSSRKTPGFFNMFRKTSIPAPAPAQQYQIWHPNAPAKTSDSSPNSVHPPPEPASQPLTTVKRAPPPLSISMPVPIHDNRNTSSHVFTPFRYLTTRRNRAVSVASLEAHDGTATNTAVGSPTASMHSTAPPMLPPPLRDPYLATEQWRDKEEARAHARAKIKRRRQRPGVVFDVDEEDPNVVKQRPRRVKTKGRSSSKQPESSQP